MASRWNPSWDAMPWNFYNSPQERFQGRQHLLTWFLALVAGTANDAFFMALPIVDNFWQAQACIMLTPRMPLYIPCVYITFMYCGAVAAWRLNLPPAAEAAAAGILGEMIYAPYDITGIKFVWWTWHDTDAAIQARILGAPVGSSIWVVTFAASFHLLLRFGVLSKRSFGELVRGSLLVALLSTPLMMVQMALLQLVSGDAQGRPTERSLAAVLLIYFAVIVVVLVALRDKEKINSAVSSWSSELDWIPRTALTAYYLLLFGIMCFGVPENHVSTGVHQSLGPCDITDVDLSGHTRQVYLCADTHTQDFTFDCGGPEDGYFSSDWYRICGMPHKNFGLWLFSVASLALVGTSVFRKAFAERPLAIKKDA